MFLNYAYTTLLTRSSYLAGVIVLAHTLRKHHSPYPLVVVYTDTLPQANIRLLEAEASKLKLVLKRTTALQPKGNVHLIAERFGDTWTKLRVFELFDYEKVCYLDADMIVLKSMDTIFDVLLPSEGHIAADHACVCNLDKDAWAPEDWVKENCAYTVVEHPDALRRPTQPVPGGKPTHQLLNGGMFLFHPSEPLWSKIMDFFNTSDKLSTYKFPDQDFLADFFAGKWLAVGWQYNALKTMRYWHPNIWRDDEVVCLHYIVDKPWAKRVGPDGVAGYLGKDGETHRWWWEAYRDWEQERERQGQGEVLSIMRKHIARPLGSEDEEAEELRAIGSQVQAFANNKAPGGKENEQVEAAAEDQKSDDARKHATARPSSSDPTPVLRHPRLGERGHGPVAHPNGGSMNLKSS